MARILMACLAANLMSLAAGCLIGSFFRVGSCGDVTERRCREEGLEEGGLKGWPAST